MKNLNFMMRCKRCNLNLLLLGLLFWGYLGFSGLLGFGNNGVVVGGSDLRAQGFATERPLGLEESPKLSPMPKGHNKVNTVTDNQPLPLNLIHWESLGFSPDGSFFASITYGVEHSLAKGESNFFAKLNVLHLRGKSDELVFERILRRSEPLRLGQTVRSIMQDLLRRESKELRKFQIEALEQGEVLLSSEEEQRQISLTRSIENAAMEAVGPKQVVKPFDQTLNSVAKADSGYDLNVAIEELTHVQQQQSAMAQQLQETPDVLDRIYTVTRNANTTVFQIKQLRLDGANSLRGQIIAIQSQGFPHRYVFQQNWNTLLQDNLIKDNQLLLRPVFISLAPDAVHLLLTMRIYGKQDIRASADLGPEQSDAGPTSSENMNQFQQVLSRQLDFDDNYAFVTFSVQVY